MNLNQDAIWPVLSGLLVAPVNRRVKDTLNSIVNHSISVLRNKPGQFLQLPVRQKSNGELKDDDAVDTISDFYETWRVAKEGALHLYVNTKRGLFCMHLPSGIIVQGLRWDSPFVPSEIDLVLKKTDISHADSQAILDQFQLNCLLNMLLKDVNCILARNQGARTHVPVALRKLVNCLKKAADDKKNVTTSDCLEEGMFNSTVDNDRQGDLRQIREFLTNRGLPVRESLFYSQNIPETKELIEMAAKMGMVFHSIMLIGFVLFVEKPKKEQEWSVDLPTSLPEGGCKWLLSGRIRYTIQ